MQQSSCCRVFYVPVQLITDGISSRRNVCFPRILALPRRLFEVFNISNSDLVSVVSFNDRFYPRLWVDVCKGLDSA